MANLSRKLAQILTVGLFWRDGNPRVKLARGLLSIRVKKNRTQTEIIPQIRARIRSKAFGGIHGQSKHFLNFDILYILYIIDKTNLRFGIDAERQEPGCYTRKSDPNAL